MADPHNCAIGIDVGGTKIAAGIVTPAGDIVTRQLQPTLAHRGGEPVLLDIIQIAHTLVEKAHRRNLTLTNIGLGVAELVDPKGLIVSDATIKWRGRQIAERFSVATSLPVTIDADVRAAACAEAQLGAGRGLDTFLYVTVGTGISAALVIDGRPFVGHRGLTGSFASAPALSELQIAPPLETFASGPAIVSRFLSLNPNFVGTTADVVNQAQAGDASAMSVIASAGRALGGAIAHLVNMLDPAEVVIGGGLGLAGGPYWEAMTTSLREYIWSDLHRDVPMKKAQLGPDAAWIGAALAAIA